MEFCTEVLSTSPFGHSGWAPILIRGSKTLDQGAVPPFGSQGQFSFWEFWVPHGNAVSTQWGKIDWFGAKLYTRAHHFCTTTLPTALGPRWLSGYCYGWLLHDEMFWGVTFHEEQPWVTDPCSDGFDSAQIEGLCVNCYRTPSSGRACTPHTCPAHRFRRCINACSIIW